MMPPAVHVLIFNESNLLLREARAVDKAGQRSMTAVKWKLDRLNGGDLKKDVP